MASQSTMVSVFVAYQVCFCLQKHLKLWGMLAGYFSCELISPDRYFWYEKQQHTFCLFTQHWRSCIIGTIFPNVTWQVSMIRYWSWQIIGFIPSVFLLHLTFVKVPRFVPITFTTKTLQTPSQQAQTCHVTVRIRAQFQFNVNASGNKPQAQESGISGKGWFVFLLGSHRKKNIMEWWIGPDETSACCFFLLFFPKALRITGPSNWKGLI